MIYLLILTVVAGFAPTMVFGALGWTSVLTLSMLGGLATMLATVMGQGWKTGLWLAVPFAAFTAAVVWTAPYALLAALVMAAAAFARGYCATTGLHNALMMSVISLGFIVAQPPDPGSVLPAPVFAGLVVLATSLWVTLVVFAVRRWMHPMKLVAIPRARALGYSSVLAIMVGVATWFVVHFDLGHAGGWIILTIVVVFQPSLADGIRKGIERSAGTLFGFIIAMVIGLVVKDTALLYVLGMALMLIAEWLMLSGRPYWQFATALTPAIVLVDGANTSVVQVAEVRLGATLIAVVATMAVMLALTPVVKHLSGGSEPVGAAHNS